MLWANCCRIVQEERAQQRKKPPPKLKSPAEVPSFVNVGIGCLAAGEVSPTEVLLPDLSHPRVSPFSGGLNRGASTVLMAQKSAGHAAAAAPGVLSDSATGGDEIMPFRRGKSQRGMLRRKSVACMEGYLDSAHLQEETLAGIAVSDLVIRGPTWCWGDEDGGCGCVGTVMAIDQRLKTVQVTWQTSGKTFSHYRCGSHQDVVLEPEGPSQSSPKDMAEESSPAADPAMVVRRGMSKHLFADPSQTFIVLDWDDTLFPTTYVRDDLGLCWQTPMRNQRINPKDKIEISRNLQRCAENCCALLRAAASLGRVVLVTLARSPWVSVSCDHFFPTVGLLISELRVPVIYAQEGVQVDYNKAEMSADGIESHWSQVKGKAIAKEISAFYSQYEGQSWKNIISIGDSDFERLGTMQATQGYMKQTGISRARTVEVSGHVYKVRTKTFKMLDQPSVEELIVELAMVLQWLPFMIRLDSSFDVNLDDLEDPATVRHIERTLKGARQSGKASETLGRATPEG